VHHAGKNGLIVNRAPQGPVGLAYDATGCARLELGQVDEQFFMLCSPKIQRGGMLSR
jgi:hypothetical protein